MHNKSSHASLAARLSAMLVLAFCSTMSTWAQGTTAVDTTDDIDYDYWLRDAGLRIDGYKIQRIDRPTKAQKAFLEAMQLLKK